LELGQDFIDAVLADWRTAPVSPKVRAMLGFLEKLTLQPDAVEAADAAAVREAGVSTQAINDAVAVCVAFSMITRLADSFNFQLRSPAEMAKDAGFLMKFGYR
jgi:alkylhydroperoxidase family enzyme